MDHKLSQVSKMSNTPDTEERNRLTWQTGIVMACVAAIPVDKLANDLTEVFSRFIASIR
jgi:hypothetical protein